MSYLYDYIPRRDSELVVWSGNFTTLVTANAATWGIPVAEVVALQTASAAFAALYAKSDSPARDSVIVAEKNTARNELTAIIRRLAGFRLKNPLITDAERVALGLRARDVKPSTRFVSTSRPELALHPVDFRRLKVLFHDMNSTSRAKPYGALGALIACAVLDAPPADPDALTRTVLAPHTPHILEFTEEERGKTVYVAICWQNRKGQKGPWSEIVSAVIP